MIGWSPRYSTSGKLTASDAGHWRDQWLIDDLNIFGNGTNLVIGGSVTPYLDGNELSAAGGRWAAFRTDPVRVYTSDGQTIAGAGVPAITASDFAYVLPYQADAKSLLLNGAAVAAGAITDVRLSTQALVWSASGETFGLELPNGTAERIQAAPVEFRPVPVDTPDGPWVLNHTQTGVVLRPFASVWGYRFDNGGQCYYPDGFYSNGTIRVAFSNERGEISEHLFPLSAARIDLRIPLPGPTPDPPKPPDPSPPIPEPEPEPPKPVPTPPVSSLRHHRRV